MLSAPDDAERSGGTGSAGRRWPSGLRGPGALLLAGGVAMLGISGARWIRYLERAPSATMSEVAAGSGATLLFVYRDEDCDTYAALPERWDQLFRRDDVRVVGVPLGGRPPGERDGVPVNPAARPAFPREPALAGAAEVLMLRLGFERTPFSVLLDGEGRVRLVVPPVQSDEAWEAGEIAGTYAASLLAPAGDRP